MSTIIQKTMEDVSNELITKTSEDIVKPIWHTIDTIKNTYHYMINSIKESLDDVLETVEAFKTNLRAVSASSLLELAHNVSCPIRHKIVLIDPNHTPIREKVRRVPYSKRIEFKKMLDDMLNAGLIQKSDSPWSSPVLLVPKPDGSIRFTVDYSKLNSITVKDAHPLPNQDDMFALLANSKWYTKLDLYQGFFQILLDEFSKKFTAFSCEMMNMVLKECIEAGYVCVFLNDILIHSSTLVEHLQHLNKVVEKLCEFGLKIKLKKCELVKEEVSFLGHVISYGRIKPDPSKVEALHRYTRPTNLTQVQSFLGLAQYYRKFIEFFSMIAAPLYFLASKDGCDQNGNLMDNGRPNVNKPSIN
ncbi:unnamed protein product [Brachionus calyciflorus]|uniref:Reverse transcriptase domain-containing protein n=1 Tax=Brachionus calyciflorus TaxID=104777 RepID=A0A813TX46_9BILA|nr:unnamed protein product [Brachionus calyciflorus]